ncbi:activating signal cointegrator 1 complex subunit 2-like [Anneissia japonica]|uniref:activating signal cointegrator 1 complex subunit 2-like n=1 Tax=Anneissia japonica TaxID=1529436 RepID=UPI001425B5F9|nr:activating signal cointegrator 1 complex subunit 2-like [Anneissia japonica]XP_033115201.1 activating signal cointegrator 1 complex subunit 2-like [Anneissia japonica]
MPVANETVALDQSKIVDETTGIQKPALDVFWMDKVDFIEFSPLPTTDDQASLEEWADRLAFIEEDLKRLLRQPYHKFWSQMVFDSSLHLCLDSYLRHAPRCFDVLTHVPEQYQDSLKHVHRLVFMAFLRIATHKESKEHFITPDIFGNILYENFLFDVPKLMDLCVLYGTGNAKLLTKMINNVFSQQPKYTDDLKAVIPTIFEVFDSISSRCGVPEYEAKVSQNAHGKNGLLIMPVVDVKDMLHYLADIAQSLIAFIEIYTPAAEVFSEAGFVNRLAALYEGVVPQLKTALKERQWETRELKVTIKNQLRFAESSIIELCHSLLNRTCIQQILENSDSKGIVQKKSEDFLDAISSILAEKLFVADFDEKHSIEADLQLLQQIDQDNVLDGNRVRFILDGVRATKRKDKKSKTNDITENVGAKAGGEDPRMMAVAVKADDDVGVSAESVDARYESEAYLQEFAGVAVPTDVEISSMISSVQDLLPDLGDGFIEACLEEFNFDVSQVIDKILEEKLPASLNGLDHKMARSVKPKEETLLSQRNNIFDNDEFDVFNKKAALDKSRVHKGKKKEENVEKLLEDKSHVKGMKDLYTELGYTYDNEYDDEYDDTYDTINVGATDADSADELADERAFTTPRILQQINRKSVNDGARYEVTEELPEDPGPPRDEFVQNPAVLREKREQRYQQRQKEKSKTRQDNLKGKPKGQGQDNSTVQARRRKEANKSQRSNHNRKAMASKKMAKGM